MSDQSPDYTPEQLAAAAASLQASQPAQVSPVQAAAETDQAIASSGRGPTLPAEDRIDALMALLRAQSEQLESVQSQMGVLRAQQEEANAAAGGPLTVRYAQAAADKLDALVAANAGNPTLGAKDHYAPAQEAAANLRDAARKLARDGGDSAELEKHGNALTRFIERHHAKSGGGHVDFSAIADDLEAAVEEGIKLAGKAA